MSDEETKTYTTKGCCETYYECYWCDALFCVHGYLQEKGTTKVIPWKKLCPSCQKESDEQT